MDVVVTAPGDEPSWKQRAVERSTRAAKLRAEQRVQRFLDAAQAIITEKGTTDFTVQEVVDRSRQSLRSFYQHFDGKHELLLALFEDALRRATHQIAAAAGARPAPLNALRTAVQLLFELSRPDPAARRPLFTDFAPRLLLTHPAEVRRAHAPLLDLLTTLTAAAAAAGQLRPGTDPRRTAALTMETVMFVAQSSGTPDPVPAAADADTADAADAATAAGPLGADTVHLSPVSPVSPVSTVVTSRPVSAEEIWDFIAHGITTA